MMGCLQSAFPPLGQKGKLRPWKPSPYRLPPWPCSACTSSGTAKLTWTTPTREPYRELARAGLMRAGSTFRDGEESIYRLTQEGFERKAELLGCAEKIA